MDTKDPQISVGGKTYNNLKDLPPELQSLLADENSNGIPDIMENPFKALGKMGSLMSLSKSMGKMMVQMPTIMSAQKFIIKGKEYDNWNSVPDSDKQQIRDRLKNINPQNIKSSAAVKTFISTAKSSANPNTSMPLTGLPGVKHDSGRAVLLAVAILGLAGWLAYQFLGKQ
jgi:hypothetical protein